MMDEMMIAQLSLGIARERTVLTAKNDNFHAFTHGRSSFWM